MAIEYEGIPIPEIGSIVTNEIALEWCDRFGYTEISKRIKDTPYFFKNWEFDGASMLPDNLFAKIFKIPRLTLWAFKHDLKYAYGRLHDKDAKLKADTELKNDIINDNGNVFIAKAIFIAVDVFGDGIIKTKFSWGFARF